MRLREFLTIRIVFEELHGDRVQDCGAAEGRSDGEVAGWGEDFVGVGEFGEVPAVAGGGEDDEDLWSGHCDFCDFDFTEGMVAVVL